MNPRAHFFSIVITIGDYVRFIFKNVGIIITRFPRWTHVSSHMVEIGIMSLPVVAITGFSTGMVLAAQSFFQLADKGLAAATGILVGKAMIVELGPVLTSFMVTGRVGSAMCAELGSMAVSEQIDAMKSMSVDPMRHLVAPRIFAGLISIPLLTIFAIMMGILGGYLMAVYFFGMSPSSYFDPMPEYIDPFDLFVGLTKTVFFALLTVTICCYKGISTTGGAAGVGKSITKSVVTCYSITLISNFFLTLGLNLFKGAFERLFL